MSISAARGGVREAQASGVQELALEAEQACRAVVGVADDGMADRLEVDADLVRAAGLQADGSSVVAGSASIELEVRARLAGLVGVGRHQRANATVAADRRVDRAGARRRAPLDQRAVLAGDLAALQLRYAARGALPRSARRRAAPTCRGRGGGRSRRGRPRRPRPAGQRLGERALAVAAAGVHDEARRLVDDEQVVVLVGDRDVDRRDRGGRGRRRLAGSSTSIARRRPRRWRFWTTTARRPHERRRRSAAPRALATRQRPARGTRRAAAPASVGRQPSAAPPPRSRTKIRTTTPNVIAMSATLKAGQCGSLMKSVTAPWAIRSSALPIAPPSSSPTASHASGPRRVAREVDEQRDERRRRRTRRRASPRRRAR